jgi:hypothetical protein
MNDNFDKKDRIITAIFSAVPIILTAFGAALGNWKGPWHSKWALPNILIVVGLFGWVVILPGILQRLKQFNSDRRNDLLSGSKLLVYGGGFVGFLLGLLAAHYGHRDPLFAFVFAVIGSLWGSAFSQFNKPGCISGFLISTLIAFLIWSIIALYFTSNYSLSALMGVAGIILNGFIGGIIGPIVYLWRRTDIDLPLF